MPILTRRINSLVISTTSRASRTVFRTYSQHVPKSHKVYASADEAVKDVKSGDILLSGGEFPYSVDEDLMVGGNRD
jgi:3-oxoacid CoA-transferase